MPEFNHKSQEKMRDKQKELSKIAKEIENCAECRQGKTGKAVVGEGSPDARIIFIGEAPGKTEALAGRPFIGRSGKLLRSIIRDIGIDEKEIYITNPVKYLPLRGTPSPADIKHGKTHLSKQINIIEPKIAVLLGRVAIQGVLEEKISVRDDHGKIIRKNGISYLLVYHPSAALRFPPVKEFLRKDLAKLKKLIKIGT